ncbi:hypothetical protein Trydic_g14432 [Trypoxylus dichotomus]
MKQENPKIDSNGGNAEGLDEFQYRKKCLLNQRGLILMSLPSRLSPSKLHIAIALDKLLIAREHQTPPKLKMSCTICR